MVQKTLIALLILLPSLARAEVNLEFAAVTIPEFAQTVLKGIIKKNYILSPDVLSDGRTITVSIKAAKEDKLQSIVADVLEQNGITLQERSEYLYLTRNQAHLAAPPNIPSDIQSQSQEIAPSIHEALPPKLPSEFPVYSYRPQYRDQKEIGELLKFAGAEVQAITDDVVFYRADENKRDMLLDLLIELDKPANEVIVKAYIYEVTNTVRDVNAISAAVSLLNSRLGITVQNGTAQSNQLKLSLPNIEVLVSAFDSDNRFKQVSAPSLRVKNGKNSRFSVGTETPTVSSTTQTNTGNPVQSIIYRPSGVILDITPKIFAETIELDITQQISSFQPTTTGVNQSPTLLKREIKTVVNTKDGELILLGGLNESRLSKQRQGLSFLPRIFNTNTDSDEKSDILLVMQVQRL
ncbi:hypothetical protein LG201_13020 [Methylobacillus gramineus]|uniref:type II secretion system protein GspD n=1 Tax=Methylobacillus gramineus TaxID=755169 RepID=UPI001CFFB7D6|nr:hypothetical protein [Methylobacillus gramineus]MCB5186129.1 hypothetical protein [Methylobacillus gramineus]